MSNQTDPSRLGLVDRGASVRQYMAPFRQWMEQPDITEICVNRPGEVWCERSSVWERHDALDITFQSMKSLATAVAKFGNRNIDDAHPILSTVLPDSERVQFVLPPACEDRTVSMTIRKPSFAVRTLADYDAQGFFKHIRPSSTQLTPVEAELVELRDKHDYMGFLKRAVQEEKVIVVAGETGSGKTTFMKALMQEINRAHRIITIEDTPELFLPNHPNHVHLYYSSEAADDAQVTAASLLKSCLRMKPTRILLAELRAGETFDFINVAASGHGGSITSCHAGSCDLTFQRLALMVLQNRQGRTLPYDVIRNLLYTVVDVVVHVHNEVTGELGRHITELWYEPTMKRQGAGRA